MGETAYEPDSDRGLRGEADFRLFAHALRMHDQALLVKPRLVAVTSPSAGADWTVNVPGGVGWVLIAASAKLAASAVVANRNPTLQLSDGSSSVRVVETPASTAASVATVYSWARGGGAATTVGATGGASAGLPHLPLFGGLSLSTVTGNLDVGDQWSQIVLYVIETRERTLNELAQLAEAQLLGTHEANFPGLLLGL